MKINNIFWRIAYVYLVLPFLIFVLGWTKWFIAIPVTLIVIFCAFKMWNDVPGVWTPRNNKKNLEIMIFVILIILLWVYLSGIGGLVYQNKDHQWRNAIFEALVSEQWPVKGNVIMDDILVTRGMNYYIGFWMPSALVGKMFGVQVGYYFQALWAAIGIFIFYYMVCIAMKKIALWPLVVFIFFSGLDIVGWYVAGKDTSVLFASNHIEWWNSFQFSSFTTQLFWVFNQAIPAWIITVMLYLQNKNKYCVFVLSFAVLNSTLPFIGMLPFLAYWMLTRKYDGETRKDKIRKWAKDTFTFENILGGGVVGILSYLFMTGYSKENSSYFIEMDMGLLLKYIVFIIFEVGISWLLVYQLNKKEPLLYILLGWFCFCPLFEMGGGNNFCMRASIPALIILFLYYTKSIDASYKLKKRILFISLISVLVVGSVTPKNEILRSVSETIVRYENGSQIPAGTVGLDAVLKNNYESSNVEYSVFYKYIAK